MNIIQADLLNIKEANDIIKLLDAYARDPMGGGQAISTFSKNNLIKELMKRENCSVFLGYKNDIPVALSICFTGFSTFACRPLLNIHDLVVVKEFRGNGYAKQLLEYIEDFARKTNCCKITLEVLSNNTTAMSVYRSFGFIDYELTPEAGKALFWEKSL